MQSHELLTLTAVCRLLLCVLRVEPGMLRPAPLTAVLRVYTVSHSTTNSITGDQILLKMVKNMVKYMGF